MKMWLNWAKRIIQSIIPSLNKEIYNSTCIVQVSVYSSPDKVTVALNSKRCCFHCGLNNVQLDYTVNRTVTRETYSEERSCFGNLFWEIHLAND